MWISCIKIRNGQIISMQREDGIYYMFVVDWLNGLKNENGKWDMGKSANDNVYFPLSDNWRKQETREADCTERIMCFLNYPETDQR